MFMEAPRHRYVSRTAQAARREAEAKVRSERMIESAVKTARAEYARQDELRRITDAQRLARVRAEIAAEDAARMVEGTAPQAGRKSPNYTSGAALYDESEPKLMQQQNHEVQRILRENLRPTAPPNHADVVIALEHMAQSGHHTVPNEFRQRGGTLRLTEDEQKLEQAKRTVARDLNLPVLSAFRDRDQEVRVLSEVGRRFPSLAPSKRIR
jgi:hypothetical protein